MHGSNGLNPKVLYKMYQCYIMPRLLFGLGSIFLLNKHMKLLYVNDFHLDTLRKLQALTNRNSNAADLLLLGALPLEAELDKIHLLFACLKSGNTKLVLLAERQSLYYDSEWRSFFTRVWFGLVFVKRPGQQFFNHVGTEPPLPGYLPVLLGA